MITIVALTEGSGYGIFCRKKYKVIATLIAIAVLLGVIALALWGAILILKYKNPLGIIPIAVAAVISLSQILAGFVLYDKNH